MGTLVDLLICHRTCHVALLWWPWMVAPTSSSKRDLFSVVGQAAVQITQCGVQQLALQNQREFWAESNEANKQKNLLHWKQRLKKNKMKSDPKQKTCFVFVSSLDSCFDLVLLVWISCGRRWIFQRKKASTQRDNPQFRVYFFIWPDDLPNPCILLTT